MPVASPANGRFAIFVLNTIVTSLAVVATTGCCWWWIRHEYGGVDAFSQRIAGARLVVANPVIELGFVPAGEAKDFVVRLRNCSKTEVTIVGVKSSCGCLTTASVPLVIPSGAWRELPGRIKPASSGRQVQRMEFYTDDPVASVVPCRVAVDGGTKLEEAVR